MIGTNKATINQGAVYLQLTCISRNRAWANRQSNTLFSYLHEKLMGLLQSEAITGTLREPKSTSHVSLEAFAREQVT